MYIELKFTGLTFKNNFTKNNIGGKGTIQKASMKSS